MSRSCIWFAFLVPTTVVWCGPESLVRADDAHRVAFFEAAEKTVSAPSAARASIKAVCNTTIGDSTISHERMFRVLKFGERLSISEEYVNASFEPMPSYVRLHMWRGSKYVMWEMDKKKSEGSGVATKHRELEEEGYATSADFVCFGLLSNVSVFSRNGLLTPMATASSVEGNVIFEDQTKRGKARAVFDPGARGIVALRSIEVSQQEDDVSYGRTVRNFYVSPVPGQSTLKSREIRLEVGAEPFPGTESLPIPRNWVVTTTDHLPDGVVPTKKVTYEITSYDTPIDVTDEEFLLGVTINRGQRIGNFDTRQIPYIWDGKWVKEGAPEPPPLQKNIKYSSWRWRMSAWGGWWYVAIAVCALVMFWSIRKWREDQ
jgi:hypothetical protein